MAQCSACGASVYESAAHMTDSNMRLGEVLLDEVVPDIRTQVHALLREEIVAQTPGRFCLISVDPGC